ncbi:MAG: right-handed parallel beta-helix repeat-containing protein [Planctomycetota bacterium]
MIESSWTKTLCVCASVVVCAVVVTKAGPLQPPAGPVAPTFKTLDQVEARIPIDDINTPAGGGSRHVIAQSGSYYLTRPIDAMGGDRAIEVAAPFVTIDLNGYTIASGDGGITTPFGIEMLSTIQSGVLTVRNGVIAGFGASAVLSNNPGVAIVLEDVSFVSNGFIGVNISGPATVTSCRFLDNGFDGLDSEGSTIVRDTIAAGNGGTGLRVGSGTIVGSVAEENTRFGIDISGFTKSAVVRHSVANLNGSVGIAGPSTLVIENALARNGGGIASAGGSGLSTDSAGVIARNLLVFNGHDTDGTGIAAFGEHFRVDSNTIYRSPNGVRVGNQSDHVITRNSVSDSVAPFTFLTNGNAVGPVGPDFGSDRAWQNIER